MKIVFGLLQDFISEMKEAGQKEVRLIQMVDQKSDKYGIAWVTVYSLLTAEIARDHRRVTHRAWDNSPTHSTC